jgi:hypothetical protein
MRRQTVTVFDDFIVSATSAAPVFTPDRMNEVLGKYDHLAFQAIVENIVGPTGGTFDALLEHSNDGRSWLSKRAGATDGELHLTSLTNSAGPNVGWASVPNLLDFQPFLTFVRLRLWFSSASFGAKVKIVATFRDEAPGLYQLEPEATPPEKHDPPNDRGGLKLASRDHLIQRGSAD